MLVTKEWDRPSRNQRFSVSVRDVLRPSTTTTPTTMATTAESEQIPLLTGRGYVLALLVGVVFSGYATLWRIWSHKLDSVGNDHNPQYALSLSITSSSTMLAMFVSIFDCNVVDNPKKFAAGAATCVTFSFAVCFAMVWSVGMLYAIPFAVIIICFLTVPCLRSAQRAVKSRNIRSETFQPLYGNLKTPTLANTKSGLSRGFLS
jgi:hypothetical protein